MRVLLVMFCAAALAGCTSDRGLQNMSAQGGAPGRHAHARLYLSASGPAAGAPAFRFSGLDAARRSIALYSIANGELAIEGVCDGPVLVRHETDAEIAPQAVAAGEGFAVTLTHRSRGDIWLEPAAVTRRCSLSVKPQRAAAYSITLEREELADPALALFDARRDTCRLPDPARLSPLERVFYAPRRLSMSCEMAPGTPRLLGNALEAFNAKVEALTGSRLSQAALDAGDPTAPIDFSRAPKLDYIWLSYLNLRADYSGYMISRMLEYHAARGTTVRIVLTDALMLPLDRAILENLAARYPNVQLQLFRWESERAPEFENPLHSIHRDQHIKVFATLARDPSRSRLLMGGRNLHDPFVFDTPRDLSAYPFLRNYDVKKQLTLSFFLAYEDFEIEFSGDATVRTIAAHMASFWHRDHDSQLPRTFSKNAPGGVAQGGMRHFISVPYADGYAQQDLFVELIDAARESIVFTAPFLNLPAALDAAFQRARARGVEVRIIARMDIDEPAGAFSASLNKLFFEEYADLYNVIGFDPPQRTLHTKIYVFDRQLAVVTSTNVNQRSFLHDTEDGVLILDRALVARLEQVVAAYAARGVPQGTAVKVPLVLRALMQIPGVRRIF